MVEYTRKSSRTVIVFAIIMCVLCLGGGIAIGFFVIRMPENAKQSNVDPESCSKRCTSEVLIAETCSPPLPRYYVAHHINGRKINVDGRLDDEAWKNVPWTENFVDIRGTDYPKPPVQTKVKVMWDDVMVYVGAYLKEPHVWATYTEKDSRIYEENAFEVFLDVDGSMSMYKEIEINALGTTWDLMLSRAYMDGGGFTDWEGISEKGTYTDGQVNNASSKATFWSVEVAFPFAALNENTTRSHISARDGEMWFMTLARPRYDLQVLPNDTYVVKANTGASWYSWNPTGAVNLHLPSEWGLLFFERDEPTGSKPIVDTKRWLSYQALFDVFNALKAFKAQKGTYAERLNELDLPMYIISGTCLQSVNIQLLGGGFLVTIETKTEPEVKGRITDERHVTFE